LPYNGGVRKRQTLYIKSPQAHRLAKQLSRRMGATMSDAVAHALEEQTQKKGQPVSREKIDVICSEIATLPVLDSRPPEEILGYDEFGIPR
jgi:antitoxin VapB